MKAMMDESCKRRKDTCKRSLNMKDSTEFMRSDMEADTQWLHSHAFDEIDTLNESSARIYTTNKHSHLLPIFQHIVHVALPLYIRKCS